jgi:hypothetical protein
LRAGAEEKAVPIQRMFCRCAGIVTRWQTEVNPVHAMLGRENRQLLQGRQLVP